MRPIYHDDDIAPDAADDELVAADVAVYERALDAARHRIAEQADLERRATTEPEAALAIVQQRFRRYQQAMQDGTDAERRGERGELQRALAHYNVLSGRAPVGQTTEAA